jgi:hypothetical protein
MGKKKTLTRWANARLERQTIDWMDLPYFKITFDDTSGDVWLRFRVIPSGKFNGKIFETLQGMYIEAGMTKQEATIRANKVVTDFYRAADRCSKDWGKPFKVYITHTDKKKYEETVNSF